MPLRADGGGTLAKLIVPRQSDVARLINSILGEGLLARAATRLHEAGVVEVESRLAEGDPAKRILEQAGRCDAERIVMGSHGEGRLEGVLLGRTSQAVAHGARCSVVMVK